MQKIITSLLFIFLALAISAQTTQIGYVKTKGRLDNDGKVIPGKRLSGVSIVLASGNSTVSNANGDFSLTAPDKKFYLKNVQKNGYNLLDPEMLKKEYYYSANPLIITMETPSQLQRDQLETQRRIEKTLRYSIIQREKELDSLKEAHKLTEEEYYLQLQQLYDDRANEKLIKEMSKKYAEIDFDLIDSFQQQLSFYILNGELKKADSMLNSRGNIFDDIATLDSIRKANKTEKVALDTLQKDLDASKSYEHWQRDQLMQYCTNKANTFIRLQQKDSAAYYLAKRAELLSAKDSSNLSRAYTKVTQLPDFQVMPESLMKERFPERFGKAQCVGYGNADPRDTVLEILAEIPEELLYRELINKTDYIVRYYIEETSDGNAQMLLAYVGHGGNDLIVVLFSGASKEIYRQEADSKEF